MNRNVFLPCHHSIVKFADKRVSILLVADMSQDASTIQLISTVEVGLSSFGLAVSLLLGLEIQAELWF